MTTPDSITAQVTAQAGTIADILWRLAAQPLSDIDPIEAELQTGEAYELGAEHAEITLARAILDLAGIQRPSVTP